MRGDPDGERLQGFRQPSNERRGGKYDSVMLGTSEKYNAGPLEEISRSITTEGKNGVIELKTAILPVTSDYRIRKLTERECFRLMGVKGEDYDKIAKNQSMSSLYHLAGDSIVTACLMAIFGLLLEVDYKTKITELTEELKEK